MSVRWALSAGEQTAGSRRGREVQEHRSVWYEAPSQVHAAVGALCGQSVTACGRRPGAEGERSCSQVPVRSLHPDRVPASGSSEGDL